ncbi:hypothetical protein Cfor_11536 [Coptotermes formosanus]|uniref:DEUBAD domain-containing protein n=1 Tax=Coptotermes formosanus TaxID=36987 RepID=A0A6L2PTL4_COPFO|nr:hypothetical protein Cfor_11536 [Coptotermes formosanus]
MFHCVQALSMFSAALQSGQLGPVVQQFEVGAEAVDAANQGNMEEFVRALQKASINKDDENKQPGPRCGTCPCGGCIKHNKPELTTESSPNFRHLKRAYFIDAGGAF